MIAKILNYKRKSTNGIVEIKEEQIASALLQESPSPVKSSKNLVSHFNSKNHVKEQLELLIKDAIKEKAIFEDEKSSFCTESSKSFSSEDESSSSEVMQPRKLNYAQSFKISQLGDGSPQKQRKKSPKSNFDTHSQYLKLPQKRISSKNPAFTSKGPAKKSFVSFNKNKKKSTKRNFLIVMFY
jgi:hypothetical protein